MSDIIEFLEKMGQDAQLRHASREDIAIALAGAPMEPQQRAAMLSGDEEQLRALLGRGPLFAILMSSMAAS